MLHATYFVVGHFHMVMGVAAMFGIFAATYFWFPKMAGRMMNETLGKVHFWLSFVGAYCIFMPFHYLGIAGNIRRYSSFPDDFLQPLIPVHRWITVAALITGAAQLVFLYNLIHSRSGASSRQIIRGRLLRSSGAPRHLLPSIILAVSTRWFTTIHINMVCRVRWVTT